ncbi:MAG: GntR family transcriptional regulator [Pseudobutyrivibrio sp.]|nr:GntR family transcriptional regulator [Pseudobutyrivibrio sp.]
MLQLNYRDSRPIYEQIKDGLRKLVVTGAIAQDEKLPSVRELATSLSINPNTIQKAYRELEQEGYIYTIAGKGSFAATRADVAQGRKGELMKKFDEIVKELLYLNQDKDELIKRIEELAKGGAKRDTGK